MNDVFAKTGFWMLKKVRIKGQVLKKKKRKKETSNVGVKYKVEKMLKLIEST